MTEAFRGGDGVVSDHTIGISSADKKMLESSSEVKHFNSPSEFFAGLKCGDVCVGNPKAPAMVAVTADAHISEAFKKMIDHQVLSLPVYDKSRGRYTEFIDTIDILVHVLNAFPKGAVDPNLDFEAFMKEPVSSLTDLSSRNPYKPIEAHAPLKVALRLMATHEIHRVPIVDEEGHLISILTQSSIISQIYHNLSIFSDSHKTVGELGLGYKAKIVAARSTQIAGAAFTTARDHKVSGLAVVDDQNKLVGNISVSDLKTIGYNGQLFKRLFLDVAAFINNRPAVFVTPATSVSEVVRIFHENKIHRLYVCQGDREILGVISLSDLLRLFLNL